jgi:O-antigen/teichoic acid export membrane protein
MRRPDLSFANLVLLARGAMAAGFAVALKGSSAILMLVVFALASRAMSRDDFGALAIWFNLLSFAAVIIGAGQPALVLQTWSQHHGADGLGARAGAWAFSWRVAIFCAIGGAALLTGAAAAFGGFGLPPPIDGRLALAFFVFAATQALMLFSAAATRAAVGYVAADGPAEFFWRLTTAGAVAASLWAGRPFSLAEFFFAASAGGALSVLAQVFFRRRAVAPLKAASARADARDLARRSFGLWALAIVMTTTQFTEVALIGFVLSPNDAAGYFAALRIANVFGMITSGLAGYSMLRIASLHFQGDREALQALHRQTAGVALALGAPLMLAVALAGPWLLGLFGPDYRNEHLVLILLSGSAFIPSLAGQALMALTVTGHQSAQIRIIALNVVVRMALIASFSRLWGVEGAAAGALVASIPLAAELTRANFKHTGADPSVMSLFRRRKP